jgi:hypothetical protein
MSRRCHNPPILRRSQASGFLGIGVLCSADPRLTDENEPLDDGDRVVRGGAWRATREIATSSGAKRSNVAIWESNNAAGM